MKFDKTPQATMAMFDRQSKSRHRWTEKLKSLMTNDELDDDERMERIKNANKESFYED